jgi:hypothetical protein
MSVIESVSLSENLTKEVGLAAVTLAMGLTGVGMGISFEMMEWN